jgi:hypothetical protein
MKKLNSNELALATESAACLLLFNLTLNPMGSLLAAIIGVLLPFDIFTPSVRFLHTSE